MPLTVFTGDTTPSAADLDANFNSIVAALGLRNRVINGDMRVDQRNAGAAQTITAAAALAYTVDRWYGFCTGANVTGQRVTGTTPERFVYRFTGAASVTGIGFGTRLEAADTHTLAGRTATLSVKLANSLLTTVTWSAYYATTADSFGTLAAPTRTLIASGSFTVNSTLAAYSTQISIPAAAITGIELVFTVGAQTSGTWQVGAVQLEDGSLATPIERRPLAIELSLCQRYFYPCRSAHGIVGSTTGVSRLGSRHPVPMRAVPSLTLSGTVNLQPGVSGTFALTSITTNNSTAEAVELEGVTATSTATSGQACVLLTSSTGALLVSAEL